MEEAASKKADDYGSSRPDKPGKKGKEKAKKKSNLEIFKDELKAIQVSWVQLLFCDVLISKIFYIYGMSVDLYYRFRNVLIVILFQTLHGDLSKHFRLYLYLKSLFSLADSILAFLFLF